MATHRTQRQLAAIMSLDVVGFSRLMGHDEDGTLAILKRLQKKRNMSILFISHDLVLVKKLADRVLVMYQGKIVEENKTDVLFKNPEQAYTKGLLFARPSTTERWSPLPTLDDYQMESFHSQQITPKERSIRHEKLYAQKPLLEVENLEKTYQTIQFHS